MEFTDALFQVVQKLLPDHRVVLATDRDHHLSIDGSSVTVEVTTFEPLQEILISWSVKVFHNIIKLSSLFASSLMNQGLGSISP
jgi:hypothetical protein